MLSVTEYLLIFHSYSITHNKPGCKVYYDKIYIKICEEFTGTMLIL